MTAAGPLGQAEAEFIDFTMKHTSSDYELVSQARDYLQQLGLHDKNRLERLSCQVPGTFGSLQALRKEVVRWVEDTCYLKLPQDESGVAMAEAAILLSAFAESDPLRFLSRTERPQRALIDELRHSLPMAVPQQRQTVMPTQSLQPIRAPSWLQKPLKAPRPAIANN